MKEAKAMEKVLTRSEATREAFTQFERDIEQNIYTTDEDFQHTIQLNVGDGFSALNSELETFGGEVAFNLVPLVKENNLATNLPRLESFNPIGERIDHVSHHPTYVQSGNIIYRSHLLKKMSTFGGLTECLSFLFLSSQAGEAGHNCPIACSAGIIRVLQKHPEVPNKAFYIEKLISPSYDTNFTGAQFITEIQGGSDVGLNEVKATLDENNIFRIEGEKWFCSNANADLILLTARYDNQIPGTKGLGLFLVPALWNGKKNHYSIRRLKDKIGTRSMATGEINFNGAYAYPVGNVTDGIHIVMDNVLHLSRLFNSVCVLGMARRAYSIARSYAVHRVAFSHPIIEYPLVLENLARIKAENTAMISAIFKTAKLQDEYDIGNSSNKNEKLLLRLLVNIQKYLSALLSVRHIHSALDVLAGNGTIETFSPVPRLLRDAIVCENWEGTHNLLRAQVLKDILKYNIDDIYLKFMNEEIAKIKTNSSDHKLIFMQLDRLKEALKLFRQQTPALQQLQIRLIVDDMAILYCALMLLIEALDEDPINSTSKLDCYRYFCLLHFDKQKISYDKNYLDLISRIVSIKQN
jgi:alkylation response protein AidB-like acyl-CoA dehydrogenase